LHPSCIVFWEPPFGNIKIGLTDFGKVLHPSAAEIEETVFEHGRITTSLSKVVTAFHAYRGSVTSAGKGLVFQLILHNLTFRLLPSLP